jgi:hypothetical protein
MALVVPSVVEYNLTRSLKSCKGIYRFGLSIV